MSEKDERNAQRRTSEEHRRPFDWLRRPLCRAFELYRNCLPENLLLRALTPRRAAERQPLSKLTVADFLRTLRSAETTSPHEARALVATATAAVFVAIGGLLLVFNGGTPDRVITTGANETSSARLSDGSVLHLGARSTVRADLTGQQRVANMEEGEVIFNVAQDLARPFIVNTFLASAVVAAGARFRVTVGSSVEFQVYEGVVEVLLRHAKPGAPKRILQKGSPPFRVSVDEIVAVAAEFDTGLAQGGRQHENVEWCRRTMITNQEQRSAGKRPIGGCG